MKIRSVLYWMARKLGDLNAVRRGPKAVVKRVNRKIAYRFSSSIIRKVLK